MRHLLFDVVSRQSQNNEYTKEDSNLEHFIGYAR